MQKPAPTPTYKHPPIAKCPFNLWPQRTSANSGINVLKVPILPNKRLVHLATTRMNESKVTARTARQVPSVMAQPSGPKSALKAIIVRQCRPSLNNVLLAPLAMLLVSKGKKIALSVSLDTIVLKLG